MGRAGPPGQRRVRRLARPAVAPGTAQPALPGSRLWLRVSPRWAVSAARPAVGTRRSPRSGPVAGQPADGETARTRGVLPDRALHTLAAGRAAVLSQPRQHVE